MTTVVNSEKSIILWNKLKNVLQFEQENLTEQELINYTNQVYESKSTIAKHLFFLISSTTLENISNKANLYRLECSCPIDLIDSVHESITFLLPKESKKDIISTYSFINYDTNRINVVNVSKNSYLYDALVKRNNLGTIELFAP